MPFSLHLFHFYGAIHPAIALAATSAKKTKSSSSFVFILLILVVGAYLFLGPQRKRRRQQVDTQRQIAVGDEVVTTSGIIGLVETLGDDRVQLTIAPGMTIEVLRGAVARRIDPVVPPSDEVNDHEQGGEDSGDAEDTEPEGSA